MYNNEISSIPTQPKSIGEISNQLAILEILTKDFDNVIGRLELRLSPIIAISMQQEDNDMKEGEYIHSELGRQLSNRTYILTELLKKLHSIENNIQL